MKYFFVVIFISLGFLAKAQEPASPIGSAKTAVKILGRGYIDSAFMPPFRDTAYKPLRPALAFYTGDSLLYFWNMRAWTRVRSATDRLTDSLRRSGDSIYFTINGAEYNLGAFASGRKQDSIYRVNDSLYYAINNTTHELGSLRNWTLTNPNVKFPYASYIATGNSIKAGIGASLSNATSVRLVAQHVNLYPYNIANPGDQAADQLSRLYRVATNNNNQLFDYMPGANDVNNYAADADKQANFSGFALAGAAWAAIPAVNKVNGQSSAVTKTGTWSNSTFYGGNTTIQSTTNGDNISFVVNGTVIYICYTMMDGNGGTFSMTVDGISQGSFNCFGTNSSLIATLNGQVYGSYCKRIPGLSAGNHTVVITVTSSTSASNRVLFDWAGGNNITLTGAPTVLWGDVPFRFSTANLSTYNGIIVGHITNLQSDGFKVYHVQTWNALGDTAQTISYDGSHPNNLGQQYIAGRYISVIDSLNGYTGNEDFRTDNIQVNLSDSFTTVPLGNELTSSTGWSGSGWTGTYVDGFYHTNGGGTTALTYSISIEPGAAYRVRFGVNSGFTGNVVAAIGGVTLGTITAQGLFYYAPTVSTTATITFTPTNDFSGRIKGISVRKIVGQLPAFLTIRSSGDNLKAVELRTVKGANSFGIGVNALASAHPLAYYNNAWGLEALSRLTTGQNNTAIGPQAGSMLTTGSNNIAIGPRAGSFGASGLTYASDLTTQSGQVLISSGTSALPVLQGGDVWGLNLQGMLWGRGPTMGIGDIASTGGIGIGTRNPLSVLHLYSPSTLVTTEESGNGTGGHIENIIGGSTVLKRIQNNGTGIFRMLNSGAATFGNDIAPNGMLSLYGTTGTPNSLLYGATDILTIFNNNTTGINVAAGGSAAGNRAIFGGVRYRGTFASPTLTSDGDISLSLIGSQWDGSAKQTTARLDIQAIGTQSSGTSPQGFIFNTGSTNSASLAERWRISPAGNLSNTGSNGVPYFDLKAGTTSVPQFRLASSSDPSSPAAGYLWNGGGYLKLSPSTTTKRFVHTNDVAPSNGQIPIGNGTDYTVANITGSNGITVTNGSGTINISPNSTVQSLTDGATITWNIANGFNSTVTLGGNRTLAITNPVTGGYGTIKVIQDGTGSRTLTLPAGSKVAAYWGSGTTVNLSSVAGTIDILKFYYDGTNYFWTLLKNFQ